MHDLLSNGVDALPTDFFFALFRFAINARECMLGFERNPGKKTFLRATLVVEKVLRPTICQRTDLSTSAFANAKE